MTLLCDWQVKALAERYDMISPFVPEQVRDGAISYGLSSVGYDIRLAGEFKAINPNADDLYLDPKNINQYCFSDLYTESFVIVPPGQFVLGRSVERFKMPRNVAGVCYGKSTYARVGLIANITPLEPGWEGYLTLELSNTSSLPVMVYVNEGIAQILFSYIPDPDISYADRAGKYQNQPAQPIISRL